jgi:hypothetical protein
MSFTADTTTKLYLVLAAVGTLSATRSGLTAAVVLLAVVALRALAQRQVARSAPTSLIAAPPATAPYDARTPAPARRQVVPLARTTGPGTGLTT